MVQTFNAFQADIFEAEVSRVQGSQIVMFKEKHDWSRTMIGRDRSYARIVEFLFTFVKHSYFGFFVYGHSFNVSFGFSTVSIDEKFTGYVTAINSVIDFHRIFAI